MYMNNGYLNHSHIDFKDKSLPLIVGSCGTYRLSSQPKLPTYRPRGRLPSMRFLRLSDMITSFISADFFTS